MGRSRLPVIYGTLNRVRGSVEIPTQGGGTPQLVRLFCTANVRLSVGGFASRPVANTGCSWHREGSSVDSGSSLVQLITNSILRDTDGPLIEDTDRGSGEWVPPKEIRAKIRAVRSTRPARENDGE